MNNYQIKQLLIEFHNTNKSNNNIVNPKRMRTAQFQTIEDSQQRHKMVIILYGAIIIIIILCFINNE